MIKVSALSYSYRKKGPLALKEVSFSMQEGEIYILLGPNGAGKSTLISLLTNTKKIQKGNIEISDKSLTDMKFIERNRLIGYVPQTLEFADLSVYETILLGRLPYFYFSPCKGDKEAVLSTLDNLGLSSFSSRNVNELSGGEKQLVAIAQALVKKPKILILDEPTSNLDLANQVALLRLIKRIAKENKVTVLISMHDLNEALLVGEHFLLIKEGNLLGEYSLENLKEETLSTLFGISIKLNNENGQLSASIKENI